MDIKFDELLKHTKGTPLSVSDERLPVSGVSTDSRSLEKGNAFFALTGNRFDGHDFLAEAVNRGASYLVISEAGRLKDEYKKRASVIVVRDTLAAYGDLAKFYRERFRIPAVAITGSAGKTTVKELVAHVLSQNFCVLKNRGTENNLVGVPKTIFQLEPSYEAAVIEMGTNRPGEIERLSSIIGPQIGVITLIGPAHLEGLKTLEGVSREKTSLVAHIARGGWLVLNGEDPRLHEVQSGVHKVSRAAFSSSRGDWFADGIRCGPQGSFFRLNGKESVEIQLIGRHNVLNCLLAAAAGHALGVDLPLIKKALETFKGAPGRLQLKTVGGIRFLDDTYNANPNSFEAALAALQELKPAKRKGVVLGDMLELGTDAERQHRRIGRRIAEHAFDFVVGAGPFSKFVLDEAVKRGFNPKRTYQAVDSAEAGKILKDMANPGDSVLVKGSRGMKMEKVLECFITSSPL